MKEWLLGITWYTPKRIDLVVQGQLISFIEKTICEMLHNLNAKITIPPNYKQDEVTNMCIRLVFKDAVVQKEGWKVAQLKGKYVAQMCALLQAIWLKRSKVTYNTKKLMLLMTMAKEGKQID